MCTGCIGIMYAVVVVDVTECNDDTKHHSNVITIWQTSAIKVNALLEIHIQKCKECKKKNLRWCEGWTEQSDPLNDKSGITLQAS